ncbi:MAG: DUF4388 domain-containing protein [Desulfobulbaceae bacterium]|jgi:Mrp family chromosome partitioning ATPase|nr:DUF4388 domain-containing protein [Desulfobulbaceae bacterium]
MDPQPKSKKKQDGDNAFLAAYSVKSRYAEAYRTLQTSLHFSMLEKEFHCLLVTSSLPGEGKSATTANLGFTIVQSGKRVLLIDADMRKCGLSSIFNLKKNQGFSNLVSDVFGRPISSGQVADYSLKDILTLLRLQNKTCRLNLKDDANEADLFLLDGHLVDIYWKNRPGPQKLANVLVENKILTEEEARRALGYQEKSAQRLGTILLGLGMVTKEELTKTLFQQMIESFRITSGMIDASFTVHGVSNKEIQPLAAGPDFDQLYQEYISAENVRSCIGEAIDKAICPTEEKNLFVLPAGSNPPNPSELLAWAGTGFLLAQLRQRFDLLVIDSPPVIPVSDALLLAPSTDGVVLVTRSGKTNRKAVADTLRRLDTTRANVLGCVLNRVNPYAHSYYHDYYSYGE